MIQSMIQEELRRYLSGEGYYTWGVELLGRLGHDDKVVRRLAVFCKMEYAPNDAENELVDILRGYVTEQPVQVIEKKAVVKVAVKEDSSRPQRIREIEDDKVKLLKLRADWHTRMKVTTKQMDRAYCAEMVLKVQEDLNKVYAVLDNFYEHGIEPIDVVNTVGNELVSLMNSKGSLASRISKIRYLLKDESLTEARKTELKTQLAEKEMELEKVKMQLKSV